ncbi:MAG: hypothetical protein J0I07_05510 [Myxococcales bacterium]|nr:hypothetical protein [Myxococcales bacterium]
MTRLTVPRLAVAALTTLARLTVPRLAVAPFTTLAWLTVPRLAVAPFTTLTRLTVPRLAVAALTTLARLTVPRPSFALARSGAFFALTRERIGLLVHRLSRRVGADVPFTGGRVLDGSSGASRKRNDRHESGGRA